MIRVCGVFKGDTFYWLVGQGKKKYQPHHHRGQTAYILSDDNYRKVASLADGKTAAILFLAILVAVMGVGWRLTESKPPLVMPLPEGLENWTHLFRGYEAYLDKEIHYSVVSGNSMAPTFKDGDLVLWVVVDNTYEFRVGDIIIYKHPTRPYLDNIVHRIIEVGTDYRENQFKTKGDNSPEEYWVPRANIHGLVIGVIYQK